MKVGLMPLFGGTTSDPEYVARMAKGMEDRGFHSAWLPDHIVLPTEIKSAYPYREDGSFPVDPTVQGLEPFALIAFMAAHTKAIRLGTGVLVLPQRNPALVAKQAADVDVLSGGRLDFGIGLRKSLRRLVSRSPGAVHAQTITSNPCRPYGKMRCRAMTASSSV